MAERRFSIQVFLQDLASAGLKKIDGLMGSISTRTSGLGGGAGAGIGQKLMTTPGGFGGWIAKIIGGAGQLALLPVKILGYFAKLIPGIGGIMSGVVGAAANILGGLVTIAGNIVGGIVNAFTGLVQGVTRIFTKVVSVAGRILGRLVGVASKVGLGVGAILGYTVFKGFKDNMQLADLRAVMRKVFGGASNEMELLARKLSLATPFTPMESIRSVVSLGAGKLDVKKYVNDVFDLAAATKGLGVRLEDVVNVFVRLKSGGFGEGFARLRESMTISQQDLIQTGGLTFNKGGQFQGTAEQAIEGVVKVIRKRFGGMAKQAAEVGSGPMSTLIGYWQELRRQASEAIYSISNGLVGKLNVSLAKVLESKSWAKFIAWTERAAKAVADKLVKNVEALWGWIATRDWSWGGLSKGLEDVKTKLGEAWDGFKDGAWDAIQAVTKLLAPLGKVILAQIEVWAATVWTIVGPHVRAVQGKVFAILKDVFVGLTKFFAAQSKKFKIGDPRQILFGQFAEVSHAAAWEMDARSKSATGAASSTQQRAKDQAAQTAAEKRLEEAKSHLAEAYEVEASWQLDEARRQAAGARAALPGAGDVVAEKPGARAALAERQAQGRERAERDRIREWQRSKSARGMVTEMGRRTAQAERYEKAAAGAGSEADRTRLAQAAEAEREKARAVYTKYQEMMGKLSTDQNAMFKSILTDLTEFGKNVLDGVQKNSATITALAEQVAKLRKLSKART